MYKKGLTVFVITILFSSISVFSLDKTLVKNTSDETKLIDLINYSTNNEKIPNETTLYTVNLKNDVNVIFISDNQTVYIDNNPYFLNYTEMNGFVVPSLFNFNFHDNKNFSLPEAFYKYNKDALKMNLIENKYVLSNL